MIDDTHSHTVRELAARLKLHRAGWEFRGDCPCCGYRASFVLASGRSGPIAWCASCQDKASIARILRGPHHAAAAPLARRKDGPGERYDYPDRLRTERAETIWRRGVPMPGTPAGTYLASRRIEHLIDCPDLRFLARCPHPSGPVALLAMIAAVRDAEGRFVAVHRTFLRPDGSAKASIEPPRASLGPVWGGTVRLAPLEEVLAVGELVIGEGIESSAGAGLLMKLPAWASLSAANLANGAALPVAIKRVVIAADNDAPDEHGRRAGQNAARAAWRRLRREGRHVRVALPSAEGTDFADLSLASRASA
jgi:hypothetical protein